MNARVSWTSAGESSRPMAATGSALRFGMGGGVRELHVARADHFDGGQRRDRQVADHLRLERADFDHAQLAVRRRGRGPASGP